MIAIFAHRGVTAAPMTPRDGVARPSRTRENTVGAFLAARAAGADGVELDVRLSADGVPVVHHDARLPTGTLVAGCGVATLPTWLPTLARALDACTTMAVNVEIKHDRETDPGRVLATTVAHVLADSCQPLDARSPAAGSGARSGPPRAIVSSFDEGSLSAVLRVDPELPVGLLCDGLGNAVAALDHAAGLGCASLHPFVTQVNPDLVERAVASRLALHVWTVNADADVAQMGRLGVAAIITDRAVAAASILRSRTGRSGRPADG